MATAGEVFSSVCRRVLECWTALSLAAENNWGQGDGNAKREELIQGVIDYCLSQSSLDYDDIANALANDLESQYHVILEDGSEVEIAQTIASLHAACVSGNFEYPQQLASKLGQCNLIQCQGDLTDSDEEQDTYSTPPVVHAPHNEAGPESFQEKIQATSNNVTGKGSRRNTVVDEDGWTTVL